MKRNLFGTDGIRGRANQYPMTPDTVLRLAQAAGLRFARNDHRSRVVIGKDTRISGYMLETALVAGFTSVGFEVLLTGPLPTPAVAMLTRSLRADMGVMISASHNPYQDNGIKFFGPDGFKLSDEDEAAIESSMAFPLQDCATENIGRAHRIEGAVDRYMEFAKQTFPRHLRLNNLKIVVDAANGAAFRAAPSVIWELGAEVISIGTEPNGTNINAACGSTAPERCRDAVIQHGADLGITLDGDADRVHLLDERGTLIDGDQLMALIAERASAAGTLRRNTLVATIMSNMNLERHLSGFGIATLRTRVGDRYVVERMRAEGCNIGGEQSGHIILSDFTTTGDGLVAALQALAALAEEQRPASETLSRFQPLPQLTRNVRFEGGVSPLDNSRVQAALERAEGSLGNRGRIVVRPSGTEPLIRIMTEGEDVAELEGLTEEIATAISGNLSERPARTPLSLGGGVSAVAGAGLGEPAGPPVLHSLYS